MVNKVILIGTICRYPERVHGGENAEAIFPLKTNISKGRITRIEAVQWHRIVLKGHLLKMVKRIRKNDIVYVEGVLSTSFSHLGTDSNERVFNSEVVADDIKVLSRSPNSLRYLSRAAELVNKFRHNY